MTQTRGGVYWLILPAGCNASFSIISFSFVFSFMFPFFIDIIILHFESFLGNHCYILNACAMLDCCPISPINHFCFSFLSQILVHHFGVWLSYLHRQTFWPQESQLVVLSLPFLSCSSLPKMWDSLYIFLEMQCISYSSVTNFRFGHI